MSITFTVNDVIDVLGYDSNFINIGIYLELPEVCKLTDEAIGDEEGDGGTIDNLSGQLGMAVTALVH